MKLLSRAEEIVLLAIWKIQGNAYGVTIRERVSETSGKEWAIGAVYPPLHRLEKKGMVHANKGEPLPERGGRSRVYYEVTPEGRKALVEIKREYRYSALGMAFTLLILLWVKDEISYDRFHENAGELHRIVLRFQNAGGETHYATTTPGPLAGVLAATLPEITNSTRFLRRRWGMGTAEKRFAEVGALAAIALLTGIFSGSYPAFVLSSVQSIRVLKNALQRKGGSAWFRKSLVVTQFAISIFLIIGAITVYSQMRYMSNRNLGFDKEDIVWLEMRSELAQKYEVFKNELLKNPNIVSLTRSNTTPDATNLLRKVAKYTGRAGATTMVLISSKFTASMRRISIHSDCKWSTGGFFQQISRLTFQRALS